MNLPETRRPVSVDLFFIVLMGCLAVGPSIHAGFMLDDYFCILNRPDLWGWSWKKLSSDFTLTIFGVHNIWGFRPFQMIVTRLWINVFGTRPAAFHALTIVLHLVSSCLLWELTRLLGFSRRTATMSAALFAVSPVGMDQFLMAAAGLSDPLCLFFLVLACVTVLRTRGWAADLLCMVFGFFAMLSRESGVIFPALLCLVVYERDQRWPASRRVILWMGTVALYLAFFGLRHFWAPVKGPMNIRDLLHFAIFGIPYAVIHYIGLILFPWRLYFYKVFPVALTAKYFYPLLLAALTLFVVIRKGAWFFGYAWLLVLLAPVIPVLFRYGELLDHFAYPLSYGVFLPIAAGLDRLWNRNKAQPFAALLFSVLMLISLGSSIFHFTVRGREEKAIRWDLRYESMPSMRLQLAALQLRRGQFEEAVPILRDLWEPAESNYAAGHDLAIALTHLGRGQEAGQLEQRLLQKFPGQKLSS